jgi:rfaE bifunctional protein nucleotidyltransferase chain/domain
MSLEKFHSAMKTKFDNIQEKIMTVAQFAGVRKILRKTGKKFVFTNGCFDILHLGHVTYLAKAADMGDFLIVGLNNDASVRAQNKGSNRPINPEQARATLLAALSFVDAVVIFDDSTPLFLIQQLKPDILVKGSDYDAEETDPSKKTYIVGSAEIKALGGMVKTIDMVPDFSTTAILNK